MSSPVVPAGSEAWKKPAAKRLLAQSSSEPRGTVWAGYFQRQSYQQCLMNAINNLLQGARVSPRRMEAIRARIARRLQELGYADPRLKRRTCKGNPGEWSLTVAVEVLNEEGCVVKRADKGKRAARRVVKMGLQGKKLLLAVKPRGGEGAHAVCIRDKMILDGARSAPLPLTVRNWDTCVSRLLRAYELLNVP